MRLKPLNVLKKIVEEAAKLEASQVTTKSGIYLSSEEQ